MPLVFVKDLLDCLVLVAVQGVAGLQLVKLAVVLSVGGLVIGFVVKDLSYWNSHFLHQKLDHLEVRIGLDFEFLEIGLIVDDLAFLEDELLN